MPLVYLGLGANLGDREATIRLALARLNAHDGIDVQRVSRLRETDPVGYEDQPRFLNGVARLQTELEPLELLACCSISSATSAARATARASGRGRSTSTSSCTTAGSSTSRSWIPHPRMAERMFVLEPLAELDPASMPDGPGAGPSALQ